ncbi:MAG: hypothetical protein KF729_15005 [Sandaracinaceae bacterium]|nr:hypothetical protein [Sandaracinaceae bacterium]
MTEPSGDDEQGEPKKVDATGADAEEGDAKEELFEAIDHLKNAASILFTRAKKDPTVKTATKEAGKVVRQIGDAAEPLAKELTKEVGRLTRDVLGAIEGTRKRPRRSEEEE